MIVHNCIETNRPSLQRIHQTDFVVKDKVVAESLESIVRDLFEANNEVWLILTGPLVAFTSKCQLGSGAHAWLDIDGLGGHLHLLLLAVALEHHSLKTYFLLAAIKEFFKRARTSNRQIWKPGFESVHYSACFLLHAYLLSEFVYGNSKWICSAKELFEDFKAISLELIASLEPIFLVWHSSLHEFFSIFIERFFKLGSGEYFVGFTDFWESECWKSEALSLIFVWMSAQCHQSEVGCNLSWRSASRHVQCRVVVFSHL